MSEIVLETCPYCQKLVPEDQLDIVCVDCIHYLNTDLALADATNAIATLRTASDESLAKRELLLRDLIRDIRELENKLNKIGDRNEATPNRSSGVRGI